MTDHLVKLRMHYRQKFKRPYRQNEETVFLDEHVSISVSEIEPDAAPVAYRIYESRFPDLPHEVREHDGALWWPAMDGGKPLSVPRFRELAADGDISSLLTLRPTFEYRRYVSQSFAEFFADFPPKKIPECGRDEWFAMISRGAARIAFCDGRVVVKAGIPVWYANYKFRGGFELRVGHAAHDLDNTPEFRTAGPDWDAQRSCVRRSLMFGVDEITTEIERLSAEGYGVDMLSRIETVAGFPHRPEAAARLCADALFRSIWDYAGLPYNGLLRSFVPLISAADSQPMPNDVDPRQVLAQLAALEDETLWRFEFDIVTAKDILRRLEALGYVMLDEQDEAALAALASSRGPTTKCPATS